VQFSRCPLKAGVKARTRVSVSLRPSEKVNLRDPGQESPGAGSRAKYGKRLPPTQLGKNSTTDHIEWLKSGRSEQLFPPDFHDHWTKSVDISL